MISVPITQAPSTETTAYRVPTGATRDTPQAATASAENAAFPAAAGGAASFTAALADAEQQARGEADRGHTGPHRGGAAAPTRTRRQKNPNHTVGRGTPAAQHGATGTMTLPTTAPAASDTKPAARSAGGSTSTAARHSEPGTSVRGTAGTGSESSASGAVAVIPADQAGTPAAGTPAAGAATAAATAGAAATTLRQQPGHAQASAAANAPQPDPPPTSDATASAATMSTGAPSAALIADTEPAPTGPDDLDASTPPGQTPPNAAHPPTRAQATSHSAAGSANGSSPGHAAGANPVSANPPPIAVPSGKGTLAFQSHSDPGPRAPNAGGPPVPTSRANASAGGAAAPGPSGPAATTTALPATGAPLASAVSSAPPGAPIVNTLATSPVVIPAAPTSATPAAPATAAPGSLPAPTIELATHLVGQPGWAQAVAQAIVTHAAGATGGRLRLQVQPPDLGPIDIALSIHNTSATLQIIAQHPLTQTALQQSIPQLHNLLGQQGVQLTHADVTAGQSRGQGRGHDAPPTPRHVGGPTPVRVAAVAAPARTRTGLVDDYA